MSTSGRYQFECPIPGCDGHYETDLQLSQAPECSGTPRSHKQIPMKPRKGTDMSEATTTKKKAPAKSKTPDRECQCNAIPVDGKPGVFEACDQLTRGDFAPGHDAKLKSALIYCVTNQVKYSVLKAGKVTTHDPYDIARPRGWEKFLDRAAERRDEKAAAAAKKAEAKAEAQAAKKAPAKKAPAKKAPAKKAPAKPRTKTVKLDQSLVDEIG